MSLRSHKKDDKALMVSPIDGETRTVADEKKINRQIAAIFDDPLGEAVWAYLESITIRRIVPASEGSAALLMREGMRDLVRILDQRKATGVAKDLMGQEAG